MTEQPQRSPAPPEALVRAYELLEAAQDRAVGDDLELLLEEAHACGWLDVLILVHYARALAAQIANADDSVHIQEMLDLALEFGDTGLIALALASTTDRPSSRVPVRIPEEYTGATLAQAVALLDEGRGAAVHRSAAYVACAYAYHVRGLWELMDEMYAAADEVLALEQPPPLDRVAAIHRRAVTFNQVESPLDWACALAEMGDWEDAKESALRALQRPWRHLPDWPESWALALRTDHYLLAALADEPAPESEAEIRRVAAEASWAGYPAMVELALAIRALRLGDEVTAAQRASRAVDGLRTVFLPNVELLALQLAAAGPTLTEAARRYARHLAHIRRDRRREILDSARSQLGAERYRLEHESLQQQVLVDDLTGLANRRAYSAYLQRLPEPESAGVEATARRRTQDQVTVLMIDVDRFKRVNDEFGHGVGDEVLRRIGAVLAARVRPGDIAARLGGDEFVVVFVGHSGPDPRSRGQEISDAIRCEPWFELAEGLTVTASVGFRHGGVGEFAELVAEADRNLYVAKSAGRGLVA